MKKPIVATDQRMKFLDEELKAGRITKTSAPLALCEKFKMNWKDAKKASNYWANAKRKRA